MSLGTNVLGTAGGNALFGSRNDMYRFGRGVMNGGAQSIPYGYDYLRRKYNDE